MGQELISILIPIIVIILAMLTKRIIESLIIGILAGGILLAGGNIINGCIIAIEHLVKSVATEESAYKKNYVAKYYTSNNKRFL